MPVSQLARICNPCNKLMGEEKKMTIIINKCEKRNKKAKSVIEKARIINPRQQEVLISSARRSVEKQANAMYNNCIDNLQEQYNPARSDLQSVRSM